MDWVLEKLPENSVVIKDRFVGRLPEDRGEALANIKHMAVTAGHSQGDWARNQLASKTNSSGRMLKKK